MTAKQSNTAIGIMGFIILGLVIAIVVLLCISPYAGDFIPGYGVKDNEMAIENVKDFGYYDPVFVDHVVLTTPAER